MQQVANKGVHIIDEQGDGACRREVASDQQGAFAPSKLRRKKA